MEQSRQRERTRRAILDAAAGEWAQDSSASLGRIAARAGVGRATIHRYFPDRQHLHAALISDSWAALHAAIEQASPGKGSAMDVIGRIVSAMVHVGDQVLFLFAATEGNPSDTDARIATKVDAVFLAEIERGQRDGVLDADVPAAWIERIVWSTVYTGLHAAADGLVPRHGVDDLIRRTLRPAIGS